MKHFGMVFIHIYLFITRFDMVGLHIYYYTFGHGGYVYLFNTHFSMVGTHIYLLYIYNFCHDLS